MCWNFVFGQKIVNALIFLFLSIRPFIINYSFIIKIMRKNETRDAVIISLFSEFLLHLFSFACLRIKFLLSIFFF